MTYETEDLDRVTRQGYMIMRVELGYAADIQIIGTFRQKTPGCNDSEASVPRRNHESTSLIAGGTSLRKLAMDLFFIDLH